MLCCAAAWSAEQAPGTAPPASKAVGANRQPDLPAYASPLGDRSVDYGVDSWKDVDWLLTGFEYRARYEHRERDYRTAALSSDDQIFTRARLFLGIRKIADPFRLGLEIQDSRRFLSDRPSNGRIVNEADFLQAYGELYFPGLVRQKPLSLRFGRMSYDLADRKLFARNRYRNTSNAFDGFRFRLGNEKESWEIDAFAVRPVELRNGELDPPDEDRLFFGVSGYWRPPSANFSVEPYWFYLEQNDAAPANADRDIHTLGLHVFGAFGRDLGFDYDLSLAGQFGREFGTTVRAWAAHAELGYSWTHDWNPRLAGWVHYASGDDDPADGRTERFNPLFGAAFANFGFSGLFNSQNTINPTARFSIRPTRRLRFETYYRANWLASATDAWARGGRRDPAGASGSFVGHQFDARVRWALQRRLGWQTGYAHFFPGDFVRNTGASVGSDFFYTAMTLRF